MNVVDILAEHARDRADHPAIEDGDRIVTYGDLDSLVTRAAANLLDAGIEPGDFVGVMLPNSADHIVLLCALARLGAVALAIDGGLPPGECERAAEGLEVKAVVAATGARVLDGPALLPLYQICGDGRADTGRLARLRPARPFDDHRPLLLAQTSGTTGKPKRLLPNHAQFLSMSRPFSGLFTPSERFLLVIHMTFFVGRLRSLQTLHAGATLIVNRARSAPELLDSLNARGITFTSLAPAHLRALLPPVDYDRPAAPEVTVQTTSSTLFPEERRRIRRCLTPKLVVTYGTNETGPLTYCGPDEDDAHPGTVGRVVAGIEAEVVDARGRPLPPGAVGTIRFRAPYFPTAYLDDPEATARHFRAGWFYPGDLAAFDAEGHVYLKGRADDVINNSGAKFYPIEVERVLMAHPHVAEAAVFGWPHARFAAIAVAAIVTSAPVSADELAAFCRRRIAGFKVPGWIGFLSSMPKNSAGKIVKSKVTEICRPRLPERFS